MWLFTMTEQSISNTKEENERILADIVAIQEKTGLDIWDIFTRIAYDDCEPCLNCLAYGWQEPDDDNYPGNGKGRCANCVNEPEQLNFDLIAELVANYI
jgi:hypothetical protein